MDTVDPRLTAITDCLYRVSAKAVIIHDHNLLIVEEPEGWYGIPGGGIDYGEEPVAALKRELEEEIGLSAKDITTNASPIFLVVGEIVAEIPRCVLYFRVELKRLEAMTGGEHNFRWASADELKTLKLGPNTTKASNFLMDLLQA